MRNETFLMGDRRDKKEISRLLDSHPIPIHYDFIYLCITFLEWLEDGKAKNSKDFDHILIEYLEYMEIDINEQLRGLSPATRSYLERVELAMDYFKKYLEQLDWFPLPRNAHIGKGTNGTVMQLYTIVY